jgi:predicted HTH transcriptional regulator
MPLEELLTHEHFEALLNRMEDETLDFKAKAYDLSKDKDKFEVIKDVVSMANTPRSTTSYIVLGVKKNVDGSFALWGLDKHEDEATIQAQFTDRVEPIPSFKYQILNYKGKDFGIISIPPRRVGPIKLLKRARKIRKDLSENDLLFRRGSMCQVAQWEDIAEIVAWCRGSHSDRMASDSDTHLQWERLLQAVERFDPARKYVLFSAPFDETQSDLVKPLGEGAMGSGH